MTFPDEVRKELKEECKKQKPDMHSINISISGNHNIIISQVFNTVFNIKRSLQKVEFLVLVYNFLRKSKAVEGFSPQAENSLGFYISRFGY